MNHEDLVEWVARYQRVWNSGDAAQVVACFADHVKYTDADSQGEVRGREAVRRLCEKLFSTWDMTYEVDYAMALKDVTGFVVGWHAIMRGDGREPVKLRGVDVVFVDRGGISHVESHNSQLPSFTVH
jgi:ketosteroid isomerase-like protein